ncbi:hypothetical protein [Nitritalea halalkaliphila]|uniref:hypothetical protein n=1 Tax=Nitritalea halalkaliphila TaxID=590849 RepID=UPI0012EAE305|nr:hypothetical protein [Nitritalea halalkaliphila]
MEFIQRTDVNALRSRLFASYLTAQTLVELDFGRMLYGQSGLAVALGPYAGYRLGGSSTFVSRPFDGGSRNRDRVRDGLSLNNFRYGIRGEVDIKYFRIYVMYDLNPLFESGVDPVITPISFGIVL